MAPKPGKRAALPSTARGPGKIFTTPRTRRNVKKSQTPVNTLAGRKLKRERLPARMEGLLRNPKKEPSETVVCNPPGPQEMPVDEALIDHPGARVDEHLISKPQGHPPVSQERATYADAPRASPALVAAAPSVASSSSVAAVASAHPSGPTATVCPDISASVQALASAPAPTAAPALATVSTAPAVASITTVATSNTLDRVDRGDGARLPLPGMTNAHSRLVGLPREGRDLTRASVNGIAPAPPTSTTYRVPVTGGERYPPAPPLYGYHGSHPPLPWPYTAQWPLYRELDHWHARAQHPMYPFAHGIGGYPANVPPFNPSYYYYYGQPVPMGAPPMPGSSMDRRVLPIGCFGNWSCCCQWRGERRFGVNGYW